MAKAIHVAKNGTKYVYESISYYDKDKKAPRTRQVYLGKLDPITNKLIPKRVPPEQVKELIQPSIKTIGPTLLLEQSANDTQLTKTLKDVFPNDYKELLTLAYFTAHNNKALSHCDYWACDHKTPSSKSFSSQNISKLLAALTPELIAQFLAQWGLLFSPDEMLCYDITSISSYAQSMDFVRYGYNRDKEPLPQINLAMLYSQQRNLPVFYRRLEGNISDVSTLKKTIALLRYANREQLCLVMDMGFYSQNNLEELYKNKYKFLMAAPSSRTWISKIIDEEWSNLQLASNYYNDNNEALYITTRLHKINNHRCYVHLYYNEAKRTNSSSEFMVKLSTYKAKLENTNLDCDRQDFYDKFLTITQTPKRGLSIKYNEELIEKYRQKQSGVLALLSNHEKDPIVALKNYRNKDVIEKNFDDLKNEDDCKRLRVHSDRTADSKLFINFLALIIRSNINNVIRDNEELKNVGVSKIINEMNTLREIREKHHYRSATTEPTKRQKLIIEAFKLNFD